MSKLNDKIKKYTLVLYWIFIFIVTTVLLYLILPGQPKFKYEYQKGAPWRHDNLVAPFDFAIMKTQEEIDKEKGELLKTIIPYFTLDTAAYSKAVRILKNDLYSDLDSTSKKKIRIESAIENKLKQIYSKGILQNSPKTTPEIKNKKKIKILIGNTAKTVNAKSIYSEKTAYNELDSVITSLEKHNRKFKKLVQNLLPEKYIMANLKFDNTTTQKDIDEIVKKISTTRGMVQFGESIILQGEIITPEKYQVLESLKANFEKNGEGVIDKYAVAFGKIVLIVFLVGLIFVFLFIYRRDIFEHFRKLAFLMIFMISMVLLASLINSFPNLNIYLVPLAIFPIVIRTFFDSRTAIFMLIITTLIIGFYAPNNYEFILIQVTAGIVSVFSLNKMHRRSHLVMATIWVFLTYILIYSALNLIHEGSLASFDYDTLKWFLMSSVFILLVYPLIYILEKVFGFISDVTLIEISGTNQILLRKLAEEAPGTFQHSMQIASLAEEVILKIGGNPFLVRAGALYHDIGKIENPDFFIENQSAGINPHDKIDQLESAKIIIGHVKDGIKLAQKYNLPAPIIEFIATHHGTSKAKYFYLKFKEDNPGTEIDEDAFVYPGPLPKSKEAAVVMLVDGIEAATRSLPEKNVENISKLIDKMVDQKIDDKQLDDSKLTFNDISVIKEVLLNKLINIYHLRIAYPKEKK